MIPKRQVFFSFDLECFVLLSFQYDSDLVLSQNILPLQHLLKRTLHFYPVKVKKSCDTSQTTKYLQFTMPKRQVFFRFDLECFLSHCFLIQKTTVMSSLIRSRFSRQPVTFWSMISDIIYSLNWTSDIHVKFNAKILLLFLTASCV